MRATNGTNVVFAFRSEGIETLDDFADELVENGVVVGERFRVRAARHDRVGVLDGRQQIMLTREGIVSAIPFESAENYVIE